MRRRGSWRALEAVAGVLASGVLLGGCTDADVSRFFDALLRFLVVVLIIYLLALLLLAGLFAGGVVLLITGVRRRQGARQLPPEAAPPVERQAVIQIAAGSVLVGVPAAVFVWAVLLRR